MKPKKIFLVTLLLVFACNLYAQQTKKIALTFDADLTESMEEEITNGECFYDPEVIEILKKEKVPCTVFLTALWAINYSGVVSGLSEDTLFEFGNHTYSHKIFNKNLNKKIKEREIQNSSRILELLTRKEIKLFRFPNGVNSEKDSLLAESFGQKVIRWDIDSRDNFRKNEFTIFEHVCDEAYDGAIIVFHLGGNKNAPKTAKALELIIPWLREHGYEFAKVSDL